MYIENNSLLIIGSKAPATPLFIKLEKKSVCVFSKYTTVPYKKEDVRVTLLDEAHKYIKLVKYVYLVNPKSYEVTKLFHFLKYCKWNGEFFLLFNI